MNRESLRALLREFEAGRTPLEGVLDRLSRMPLEDLGDLKLDHHRALRTGIPETIFGQGKTDDQVLRAVEALAAAGSAALATRLSVELGTTLMERWPRGEWNATARVFHLPEAEVRAPAGLVAVVSAGTADLPVAEEAAVTASAFGARVERAYDVGVAGLHRIVGQRDLLERAHVVIVAAGMEGALPSVVAGLVSSVVIAVPTSIGYGASFGGLAALLAMLNSCGSGVLVCNIDNGYGAGVAAARINALAVGSGGTRAHRTP
ncbi:MAG: nickel pincer cofactor biosynthesis protein LarB [Candidatus Eisenbacteria bacterium]